MKVALVHDYIKEYGGAEKVLEVLHDLYPDAPVFTLVYCPEFLGPHRERFNTWDIRPSFLQYIPFKHKLISIFRLLAPFLFPRFDLSSYDVVIVSATGAYCPNLLTTQRIHSPSAMRHKPYHICYCHTPPRYLYGYATARNWKKNPILRLLGETANHLLRIADYQSAQRVDQFIANSETVKKRIQKFYRRDAVVVYPPAIHSVKRKALSVKQKEHYFLAGGRLARAKHYDLIIKACAALDVPIKIFGKGFAGYEDELKSQISNLKSQNPNLQIELLGEVNDEEKMQLMAGAKAFIFAGEDEDFGIVPVEAMSMGIPVIAYRSGGLLETVIDGKTGVFFDELSVASVVQAMKKFEKLTIKPETCRKQAEKFSKEVFAKNIQAIVKLE